MQKERLQQPQDMLPAYETLEHMVRRIVREELEPVLDSLKELRHEGVRSDTDRRPRLVASGH